ncbi:MAG: molybdenum cofactor guanylyltransferase MobA [Burkholderiaceae bacterium]|jgi:molybdopterin-guanine dinucleotide biosynthesis protein A
MANQVTGLILSGGRGSRMGGVDKGLERFNGEPMAARAMMRLMPQVEEVVINANRNIGTYDSFGVTVLMDALEDFQGPLAGMLAGLSYVETTYLQAVPCDVPNFPTDLVSKLLNALKDANASVAMPVTQGPDGRRQVHPVFLLMRADVHDSLLNFLTSGGRKIDRWTDSLGAVEVEFPQDSDFFNVNTLEDLKDLERR